MPMTLKKAIDLALDGKAVLFLGSGFSFGTVNSQGEMPRIGKKLAEYLAELCGYPNEQVPLEDAAQEYIRQNGEDALIELLHKEYDLSDVSAEHCSIMSLPYIRVYTTNYDSCVEIAYQKAHPGEAAMNTVTPGDPPAQSIDHPTCVHLNGSVNRLNKDTLCSEFRLTEQSYVSETLENKPWFRQFIQDIRIAKAIIFIGYSMSFDLDVKRHLSSPEIREKLLFIVGPGESSFGINKIENYGPCKTIGAVGFAREVENEKEMFTPSVGVDYTSFVRQSHQYAVGNVAYSDLVDLYCFGRLSEPLFEKLPTNESRYLVDRTELERIVSNIRQGISCPILITASLGCGKTIFIKQLIQRLLSESANVFTFKQYNDRTLEELRLICTSAKNNKKNILILESYSQCWELLEQLPNYLSMRFVLILTERSAIHRVSRGKLKQIFRQYYEYSLTELDTNEVRQLASQLVSNGFDRIERTPQKNRRLSAVETKIKDDCSCHFSEVLLQIFQSMDIHSRLKAEFDRVSSHSPVGKLVALALFASVSNLRLDLTDLLELLNLDYVRLRLDENPAVQEFFNISDGQIRVQSSVIARELLYNIQDTSILTEALTTVVQTIDDQYRTNTAHRELLKSILSHSNFIHFVEKDEESANTILAFYDSVRNTPFCCNDPLFWEQFASAYIDAKRFPEAYSCLKTAFSKASMVSGYVPYQVESVQARCILVELMWKISTGTISADSIMEAIDSSYEHLFKYYDHPDNILSYVFNISKNYADIWKLVNAKLNTEQRGRFQTIIREIIGRIAAYRNENGMAPENDAAYNVLSQCLLQ